MNKSKGGPSGLYSFDVCWTMNLDQHHRNALHTMGCPTNRFIVKNGQAQFHPARPILVQLYKDGDKYMVRSNDTSYKEPGKLLDREIKIIDNNTIKVDNVTWTRC
jgi:hypothetical protein